MNTGYRTVTQRWELLGSLKALEQGDLVNVEQIAPHSMSATLHIGGMIRVEAMIEEIEQHTREARRDEYEKTLKRCVRCGRIEITPDKWFRAPDCFKPRDGVVLVDETCPECDNNPSPS